MFKNYFPLVFSFFFFIGINAQTTTIPDANFEQALIDLGIDKDFTVNGKVANENIENITELKVPDKQISDLTGIEGFINLKKLNIDGNQLGELDLSKNLELEDLECGDNPFQKLDLSKNLKLVFLTIHGPASYVTEIILEKSISLESIILVDTAYLELIDLSKHIDLKYLKIIRSSIKELDLTNNIKLETVILNGGYHQSGNSNNGYLKKLDLSKNINLIELNCNKNIIENLILNKNIQFIYCNNNRIKNLNTSETINLERLSCEVNPIIRLDLSNNKKLTYLNCSKGILEELNLKNENNTIITYLNATNNPDLQCIQVDNETDANNGVGNYINWIKDATVNYSEDCSSIVKTYVPDNNFEQALIDLGYDDVLDDYVFTSNISGVTTLFLENKKIEDVTGLEDFVHIEDLNLYYNDLTSIEISKNSNIVNLNLDGNNIETLDVSQNLKLQNLSCSANRLTSLNVNGAKALVSLNCIQNGLTNLDVTQNSNLEYLHFYNNQITSIDVSQNQKLVTLSTDNNPIKNLDVTNNIELKNLTCNNTSLTSLDISYNINLEELYCQNNQIESLDLSQKPNLESLWCRSNNLTYLDLSQNPYLKQIDCTSNQLISLNVKNSNNLLIYEFSSGGNPLLTCIQVDNETAANAGTGVYSNWYKDDAATFSENCSTFGLTYVPDDNFEQALIDLGYDDVLDDYVVTSNISGVTELDVHSKSINDLTGVEGFDSLMLLKCYDNKLTKIDVSQNTKLEILSCGYNQLTSIDVSNNVNLINFALTDNLLTNIDVSKNVNLEVLNCVNNQITSIDITQNAYLYSLNCSFNSLTNLDVSKNLELKVLALEKNQITNLDLSNNIKLTGLYCSFNSITDLDVSKNIELTRFGCESNQLTNLDVSNNIELTYFYCSSNSITYLDLSKNVKLNMLNSSNNSLTNLDVSNNNKLRYFRCFSNSLTYLDVSKNLNLLTLLCHNNQLISLNVKNGNNSILESFNTTNNQSLSCIQVDNEADANAGNGVYSKWEVDNIVTFSEDCQTYESDDDNDGVINGDDTCPNTPNGETVNTNGCSESQTLGIEDEKLDKSIKFYPNPVSNILLIQTENITIEKVEIYSSLGQKVKEVNSNFNSISTDNLSKGIYIIKIFSEKGTALRKLIKQ